jgi:hypothetical protein
VNRNFTQTIALRCNDPAPIIELLEQTQAWSARLRELVDGEPEYRHYDELHRTDF